MKKKFSLSTFRKLCRARDLLRECYAEPIQLFDLAAETDLSEWHLLRIFRDAFGETPHQFLRRIRLEKAQTLLTVTSRSVTEVCLDVGFSSVGSFSTLFARRFGLSPREFRRQVRTMISVPGKHPWACVPFCFAWAFGERDVF